jgi:hypothetical protein
MQLDETMIGIPIFTRDDSQIGTLKEIHRGYFKVDAPFQPDYWLSDDHLTSASGNELRLAFTEDQVGDYRLGHPEEISDREGAGMGAGIPFDSAREAGGGFTADRGLGDELPNPTTYGQQSNIRPIGAQQPVTGWTDVAMEYREHWMGRHGGSGGRFEDYEPGYRYGYEMAHDPRYEGREWSSVEPELRQNYGTWSRAHGYRYDDNEWDRIK